MLWAREKIHLRLLFQRLGIMLLILTLCRPIFYLFNQDLFPAVSFRESLWIFWIGLWTDAVTIIQVNLIFIALHLIPNPWREKRFYQNICKVVFYTTNALALCFEASDWVYYRYALKRITSDIVFMEHDAGSLAPTFIKDFWYIALMIMILLLFAEWMYRKTSVQLRRFSAQNLQRSFYFRARFHIPFLFLCALVFFVGARGGITEPLSPNKPAEHIQSSLAPLAQNTSFTLLYSIQHQQTLDPRHFFSKEKQLELFNAHQTLSLNSNNLLNPDHKKLNVCFIIIESFSKEYTGYFNNWAGYTPFLDSLMEQGYLFTNAFANGKKSIEGIPAVLSSYPGLINDPLLASIYQNNRMESVAGYLKTLGYQTAFFHGGSDGTMNFDKYTAKAGFDHYYGLNEYPDRDRDFDGNWGIYDEPFLKFMAGKMDQMKEPFCTAVFTLSSHHPFSLPPKYEGRFPKGNQPINEVTGYTDYSIRRFFETASRMPWFKNTLFVITADHCGPPEHDIYKTKVGIYEVPILFYLPGSNLKGTNNSLVQQTDIMPTVLEAMGYYGKVSCFGRSMFTPPQESRYAVNFLGTVYQIIDDRYNLLFDGNQTLEMYDYRQDPYLKHNLLNERPADRLRLETKLKAVIQEFNDRVIQNELAVR